MSKKLHEVVADQSALITQLEQRIAQLETRPATMPAVVAQLTKPGPMGKPGTKATCDIANHGLITLNRDGICPKCYCAFVMAECAAKRGNGRRPTADSPRPKQLALGI